MTGAEKSSEKSANHRQSKSPQKTQWGQKLDSINEACRAVGCRPEFVKVAPKGKRRLVGHV